MRFSITLGRKGRMAIGLNSLFNLGRGMTFDCFQSSGNEDIVKTKLNKWVKYGISAGDKVLKNRESKSEPTAFPTAVSECTLENNVFCIINYFPLLLKTGRGGGFAHSVQEFPKIYVNQWHLCNAVILLCKFPTNLWAYVRDKSRHQPFSIFIVPSSLIFLNCIFPKVLFSRFRFINLHSLCHQQIHRYCTCYYKYAGRGYCTICRRDTQCSRFLYWFRCHIM